MLISIIVPCYNCEETIRRCIDSLINQSYSDIEIVLVDDGSTDHTPGIIDEYSEKDRRVISIHKQNGGSLDARKQGLHMANGEYAFFVDADDYVNIDIVEQIDSELSKRSVDILLFCILTHYPNGYVAVERQRLSQGYYDEKAIKEEILPHFFYNGEFNSPIISMSMCNKVYRRSIAIDAFEQVDSGIWLGEDALFNFVFFNMIKSAFSTQEISGYNYIRTVSSKTGIFDPAFGMGYIDYFDERLRLAKKMNYQYTDQLYYGGYCGFLLFIKKIMSRSGMSRRETIDVVRRITESEQFKICKEKCSIAGFNIKERFFGRLINHSRLSLAYYITRIVDKGIKAQI